MNRDDDDVIGELRRLAARMDPPPPSLRDVARGAFAWRSVDRELAELAYDSAVDEQLLAGVRGQAEERTLTFVGQELTVEVEVAGTGSRRRLVGQIVPPQPARVEVRQPDATQAVDADELGRFSVADLARGPASLRCRLGAGGGRHVVDTEWLVL